jgi:hypothetical protein
MPSGDSSIQAKPVMHHEKLPGREKSKHTGMRKIYDTGRGSTFIHLPSVFYLHPAV